jgi:hypothetical protein
MSGRDAAGPFILLGSPKGRAPQDDGYQVPPHFKQTQLRILAAHFARALLHLLALLNQEGAGKAGCRLAPTVRCAHVAQKELHSGIQVKPNTRPSLRSGLTAYAVLSREPNSFGLPRFREIRGHRAG